MFTAIMDYDAATGAIKKYQDGFETIDAAQAHIDAHPACESAFVVEAPEYGTHRAMLDLSGPAPMLKQKPVREKAPPVTKRLSDTGRIEDELLATQELLAEAEYTIKTQAETITTLDERLTAIEEGRANG